MKREILPGDWVRLYRDGQLVLAVVAYLRTEEGYPGRLEICTDRGVVFETGILEVRRVALPD